MSKAALNPDSLDWDKAGGLLPAIVQDADTAQVLMLGTMNREALEATLRSGLVTFFSRSRQRLWQKGETSGHLLELREILADCDQDALLIKAEPKGPTCHLGKESCFGTSSAQSAAWLGTLERIVRRRAADLPQGSYTTKLLKAGPKRIAQKVGEEAVEVALAATAGSSEECAEEIADLLYHLVVLMRSRQLTWSQVMEVLSDRAS
jgi:phosphoribosyl-ATP pyrophosphohydrolase/phosphoribosyl-AMP cyclohydrolase